MNRVLARKTGFSLYEFRQPVGYGWVSISKTEINIKNTYQNDGRKWQEMAENGIKQRVFWQDLAKFGKKWHTFGRFGREICRFGRKDAGSVSRRSALVARISELVSCVLSLVSRRSSLVTRGAEQVEILSTKF